MPLARAPSTLISMGWYKPKTPLGDAIHRFGLGVLYDDGQRRPQDYARALDWYRKAAEIGAVPSEFVTVEPQELFPVHSTALSRKTTG